MSSPIVVSHQRETLFMNGLMPIPIQTGKKTPVQKGYQQIARNLTAEGAKQAPDNSALNTAILLDDFVAVDIDLSDQAKADWVASVAEQMLGKTLIRSRLTSPRRALLYRVDRPVHGKPRIDNPDGKKAFVEVLGYGRHLVLLGSHESGDSYQLSTPIADVKPDSWPIVTHKQLDTFLEAVQKQIGGVWRKSSDEEPQEVVPVTSAPPIPTPEETRCAETVTRRLLDELRVMREGSGRNQALNDAALQLGELSAGWGVPHQPMIAALLQASEDNGYRAKDGLTAVKATIASGFTKGQSQPRARLSAIPALPIGIPPLPAEKPRPLRRAVADAHTFPVEALGPFYWPAYAITDKIQCPAAIAALAVLGVASLAAQAHADVLLPRLDQACPLSLFLVSVGASGERKSAADREASRGIADYERELAAVHGSQYATYRNAHDAWESERQAILRDKTLQGHGKQVALDALIEPQAPLTPMLTCPEPTFEGLCQLFLTGHGALGLFSDEGGQFVGGHALSEDTRLRTAAGLSALWNGAPIKRVRAAKDGSYVLPGRRLAMHLMLQPNVAAGLLSDPILKDQGLLSRILVSFPASTAGTRFGKEPDKNVQAHLAAFNDWIGKMLRIQPTTAPGKRNELTPRLLQFDASAHGLWCEFADKVEHEVREGGKYEAINSLANKLPEHAARIAGVMTLFRDFYALHINADTLTLAITLAEHFAQEALRLFDAGLVRPEIALAESLLEWLHNRWHEPYVSLRVIQRSGPNAIRDAKTAKGAIATLVDHGWLIARGAAIVDGQNVRDAWEIVRE